MQLLILWFGYISITVDIPLTGLQHIIAWSSFCVQRVEVRCDCFVDIGGIVDRSCLIFRLIKNCK